MSFSTDDELTVLPTPGSQPDGTDAGAPLLQVCTAPQPWRAVQHWIADLARELSAAAAGGVACPGAVAAPCANHARHAGAQRLPVPGLRCGAGGRAGARARPRDSRVPCGVDPARQCPVVLRADRAVDRAAHGRPPAVHRVPGDEQGPRGDPATRCKDGSGVGAGAGGAGAVPGGSDVSRSRAGWRAVAAWSPILLLWIYVWAWSAAGRELIDTFSDGWAMAAAALAAAAGCVWAVVNPARGLADRATGTCLVPR